MTLKVYCTCIGHLFITSNYCFWIKVDCVYFLDDLKPGMMNNSKSDSNADCLGSYNHVLAPLNC